ncbi:serine/threonine-protein phosphatase [Streptomyces sp. LX-29]|uniref:PP2C family protein-serine/threonine phosphatase n=1 Tax=Streptomyces sp. LX-29 TaxID=2900152 RepID=UPI00240CE65B|nr:PP2C family protein-serine/threonine phosphatase [Streptomyces sp. LX-29]WFB06488.1 serine/threonine-protein phosphatase [Streptomyces sp. LX-29]
MANSVFIALLVYIGLIVVVDQVAPRDVRMDMYAAVAPIVAAALCTYRQAVLIAAVDFLAMATLHGAEPDDPQPFNTIATVFGNLLLAGAAITLARLLYDREKLLTRLRVTGEAAQRALLRQLPLRSRGVVVDGLYVSSQRDALVGGDIYEVLETPYGTRVLIGDVQGKGLRTLGAGAAVLTAFREAAFYRPSLESAVDAMESGLWRYARSAADESEGADERFVTALVFGVEEDTWVPDGTSVPIVFVDCGHVAPLLIHGDGRITELAPPDEAGLPLGLGQLVERPRAVQRVAVPAEARVFACTDGVTEARGADGAFYPLADRLSGWAELPTSELLARLREDLDAHTGGRLQDDAAALIMERAAADAAPDGGRPVSG